MRLPLQKMKGIHLLNKSSNQISNIGRHLEPLLFDNDPVSSAETTAAFKKNLFIIFSYPLKKIHICLASSFGLPM